MLFRSCATLGLVAAVLGWSGQLLNRERPGLLMGPFAQPVFRSPRVAWMFAPAVAFSLFATLYHTASPTLRAEPLQLWAPYLAAAGLVLVCYPLHPPDRPDNLRVGHFPRLEVPCLFVSGDRDRFGSP